MPDTLKTRVNQWREADAVRDYANGRGGCGGTARWWHGLDLNLKTVLLDQAGADNAARYVDAAWLALPDGLQTAIALNARRTARTLALCSWR